MCDFIRYWEASHDPWPALKQENKLGTTSFKSWGCILQRLNVGPLLESFSNSVEIKTGQVDSVSEEW